MPKELTPKDFIIHPPIDDDKFFIIGILPDSAGEPSIVLNLSKTNCKNFVNKLNQLLNESEKTKNV